MITTAPLYTGKRVRTHTTNIGRILCTGKGCIGCGAKRLGNKNVREVLGDVDVVDFGASRAEFGIRHGSALVSRPTTAPGCYGDGGHKSYFGPNGEVKKAPRRKENNTSGVENSDNNGRRIGYKNDVQFEAKDVQMCRSVLAPDGDACFQQRDSKSKQHGREVLLGQPRRNNARSFTRSGETFHLKTARMNLEKTGIPRISKFSHTTKLQTKFLAFLPNNKGEKVDSTQGQKTVTNTVLSKPKMSFLEMLQRSEAGIYDVEAMEERKASRWVSKILEAGVCSEKELLPRIPSAKAAAMGKAPRACKGRVEVSPNLPRITLNDRFLYEGDDTVIIIEHENEGRIKTEESLHQLSFVVECSSVRRALPRFSVLDIAEGLGELVSMDSVQIIQRRGRKWHILVKGNCVRDFLMQHGVVVKGRRLQMTETSTRL